MIWQQGNTFARQPFACHASTTRHRCIHRHTAATRIHAEAASGSNESENAAHAGMSRRNILGGAAASSATLLLRSHPGHAEPAAERDNWATALEERVSEFTLSNGLHFIVLERHNAPVVSVHTYANVGAFDEEDGKTGVAHLLEHMAFKGTARIGTLDAGREAGLLESLDEVFYEQLAAREAGDSQKAVRLNGQLTQLQQQAEALAVPNAFGALLQRAGAVGLNAGTSHDCTKYFVSLPTNKLELWFAMEAERFQAPVFRELYSEKRVVAEERRLRVDDNPMGSFQEAFASLAFANNYRRPVIGWPSDFDRLGRKEVSEFFYRHYTPKSLTISIVGDVDPSQVRQHAEKYFGGWRTAAAAAPALVATSNMAATAAPPPNAAREYEAASLAGPAVLHAFYRPTLASPDSLKYDVIGALLSGSRTSRLNRNLVQPGRATSANAIPAYPGEKHPGVMLLYANARPGGSLEALSQDVLGQARQLSDAGPAAAELQRVKKGFRVGLLEQLASNSSMATALATYSALTGDWRRVLSDLDTVDTMTDDEVRGVAQKLFAADNMFTGRVLPLRQPRVTMQMNLPPSVP